MKKILSIIVCVLFLSSFALFAYAYEADNVFQINSLDEFLQFAENCRLDSFSAGKTFILTTDIDLSGSDFDGIPIFLGVFDGSYHTITGLNIGCSGSSKGLFRIIESDALIKNLNVKGQVTPSGTRTFVGGIAGVNRGTIENCTFMGTVTASEYAGGIVGINKPSGRIDGCTVYGTVSAFHFSGGISGSNEGTIADSTNEAGVNLTAQQNQIGIGDITLGNITNTESATVTTDIGGIAGYSSGTVINCINRGAVGYKHMGYNVGGIVGLQVGYVAECENYGVVCGRKEVGGIVGQQEPEILLRYDTDTLQILKGQFTVLSDLIERASANGNTNTGKIRNFLFNLEKHVENAEDAIDYLKAGLEKPKWEDLQSYADAVQTIRDSITGIELTVGKLWDAINDTMTDLDRDLEAIGQQMDVIENTLNNADDHFGGQVFDNSDADTAQDLTSKVEKCNNYGSVLGDLNAGGIVGAIVFENDLDPEEDISVVGDITLNAVGTVRSVILECTNSGTVNAKNQRVGGIIGFQSMGLVKECINTGTLDNPTADYVGGIAGLSVGFIRNCKVKSIINGEGYVGGIAGTGTIVSDSYAMVSLSGIEQTGCILGFLEDGYADVEQPLQGNYYLQFGKDFGAIDGISFEGKAQGLTQQDFFKQQETCPIFSQVTVNFIVDGQIVQSFVQPSGNSFTTVPTVPAKDGFVGQWDGLEDVELECVLFDLNIHAKYTAYSVTVESNQTDDQGRPILLLQGEFSGSEEFTVKKLDSFSGLQNGQTVLQAWQFTSGNCIRVQSGRLLTTDALDTDQVKLMIRNQDGKWSEYAFRVDGSYLVFYLADGDDAVALVQVPKESIISTEVLISGAIGAIFVLSIVGICIIIKKKRKKRTLKESKE